MLPNSRNGFLLISKRTYDGSAVHFIPNVNLTLSGLGTRMSGRVASEDELGQKWDRCLADALVKTGWFKAFMHALLYVACLLTILL